MSNANKINSNGSLEKLSTEYLENLLRIAYKHNSISAIRKLSNALYLSVKNSKKDDEFGYIIGVLWSNHFDKKPLPMNEIDTILIDSIFNIVKDNNMYDEFAYAFWCANFPNYYYNYELLNNIVPRGKDVINSFIQAFNTYKEDSDNKNHLTINTIDDFYSYVSNEYYKLGVVI